MPVRVYDDVTTLHNIGSVVMSYQPYQNAFVNALVNRIGMVLVTSRLWDDPWAVFNRGRLEYGETLEEVFVNIAKPHKYDPTKAESQFMKREIPDIRAAFHTINYQKFYKATVQEQDLNLAFLSWSGITDLIARITDSLYTGMNYDMFIIRKYMLCKEILNGNMGEYPTFTSGNMESLAKKAREFSSRFGFLNESYNRAGVYNACDRDRQYIIIDAATEAAMDVDVLAKAFHMERAEFLGHLKIVDSWTVHDDARLMELLDPDYDDSVTPYAAFTSTELTNLALVGGVLMDGGWWFVLDKEQKMTQDYNGEGLYWQYWLHVWRIISASPFHNCVAFVTSAGSITSVTLSPGSASIYPGQSMQFSTAVVASGIIDQSVVYSVTGADSDSQAVTLKTGTRIDPSSGFLTVDANETAATLTVKVTSVANSSKTDTSTVTIASS